MPPPSPPADFVWHRIESGPASDVDVLLPEGSEIAGLIVTGRYEALHLSIVSALVSADDVCFDIGGHYGYYTFSLAKLAHKGQVHTFEPVAEHAQRIRRAAEKSSLLNVSVHEAAVAGEVGKMSLQLASKPGGDDSMAYLESYGGVDTPAAQEHYAGFSRRTVSTLTLDSLLSDSTLGNNAPSSLPNFIKIDAEGAEVAIVGAALQMLAVKKPRLLIEMHGVYEALGCAQILSKVGYRAILLTEQKTTMPILWTSRDDDEALQSVRRVLGHAPTVLFDRQ
ncbi:MAG: FkbM family methyltransferase [Pirellulaceae bacterium]